ncbi:MAG: hypothetical protein JEZ12_22590 [Desulfobacterium sp.]|nr:hypothetical protein [Desulfobacterium sp.]
MTSIPSSMTSMVRPINGGRYSMGASPTPNASGKKTQATSNNTEETDPSLARADETMLRSLARKYSVAEDEIVLVAETLSKEEQADFIKAADGAGNQLRHLVRTTKKLGKNHSPEERAQYLATTAKLNGADRWNFIKTCENAPSSRKLLISMVDQLKNNSGDDLSNFIEAAEVADVHAREFIAQAQGLQNDPAMTLIGFSDYLVAALKTGDAVSTFVDTADKLTISGITALTDLVNEKLDDTGISNFFRAVKGMQEDTLTTVMDLASRFSTMDRGNFLGALAQAGTHGDTFLTRVVAMDQGDGTRDTLSHFLEIMEKAEAKIGIAMVHFDAMDQAFAAGLSTIDMANYLEVVQNHEKHIEGIEALAGQLSGEDRSLFLYATARSEDIPGLMDEVKTLDGEERTAYLVEKANKGVGNDAFIYVKGLLGEAGYRNFQIAGELLHDETREIVMELVENQDADSRALVLKLATGSAESARGVVNLVPNLSKLDQETFFTMARDLDRHQQGKWIKAMDKGQNQATEILSLARTLGAPARESLAETVSGAKTKDLEAFLEMFDYLGREDEERIIFLKATDEVGTELGKLVEQSHKLMGHPTWSLHFTAFLNTVDMLRGPMIASHINTII